MKPSWSSIVQKNISTEDSLWDEQINNCLSLIREIMEELQDGKHITTTEKLYIPEIKVTESIFQGKKGEKKFYRKRNLPQKNKKYQTKPKSTESEKSQKISEKERYIHWAMDNSE